MVNIVYAAGDVNLHISSVVQLGVLGAIWINLGIGCTLDLDFSKSLNLF